VRCLLVRSVAVYATPGNTANTATQSNHHDLDGAEDVLTKSLALDPDDTIARAVKSRIAKYRAGAKLPRTMRELERG